VLPAPVFKTDNLAPVGRRADGPAPGRIESTDFRAAVIDKPSMRRDIAGAPGGFASVRAADRASAATGQVATGGFGAPTIGTPEPPPPTTSRGAFGDASVTTPRASVPAVAPAAETPVEILEKPRPAYTEEARRVGLEGEVLLEVLFPASGPARAVRVVRGLGHGLDENAIAAAEAIRFRPATRGGRPVDATATVHIVFQIAF
jgi:TonB family protein